MFWNTNIQLYKSTISSPGVGLQQPYTSLEVVVLEPLGYPSVPSWLSSAGADLLGVCRLVSGAMEHLVLMVRPWCCLSFCSPGAWCCSSVCSSVSAVPVWVCSPQVLYVSYYLYNACTHSFVPAVSVAAVTVPSLPCIRIIIWIKSCLRTSTVSSPQPQLRVSPLWPCVATMYS